MVCLQVKIFTLSLAHKVPLNASFEVRKLLKRMPSLVYTENDETKYHVSSMFAFVCIRMHFLDIVTRIFI